jgi:uncharacterized membrane protein YfhO
MTSHVYEFILKELAVSECAELLAKLEVLRITVLLAFAFKVVVFSLQELGVEVLATLEERNCFRSINVSI